MPSKHPLMDLVVSGGGDVDDLEAHMNRINCFFSWWG